MYTEDTKVQKPIIGSKETLRFIWDIAKQFPVGIGVMLATCIYWSLDIAIRPYLLKILLDRASEGTSADFWYLGVPALGWLGMSFLLVSMFRVYGYFVEIKMIPDMRKKITSIAMEHLLPQSHSFYQNNFAGGLSNKVKDIIGSMPETIQLINDKFLSMLISIIFAIGMLWHVNQGFGIAMLIWTISFIIGTAYMSKYLIRLADDMSEKGSIVNGQIVDVLSNIMLVKLFSRSLFEKTKIYNHANDAAIAEKKIWWMYFWIWMFNGFSFIVVMSFNFYYLITCYNEGTITVGDFALVSTVCVSIVDHLWELAYNFGQFSKNFGRITQGLRDILTVPEIQDKKDATKLLVPNGEIRFQNVMFNYKGTTALFEDKSIIISSGQKVGLVGYSGSGKSTFVNLILRLYDINGGEILIDDQNIADVTQDSLRENIGMIPQDPTLFHRTLMDNIRYGRIDATDEEVIEAAKRAHAHGFITSLPLGYASLVGERGVKL